MDIPTPMKEMADKAISSSLGMSSTSTGLGSLDKSHVFSSVLTQQKILVTYQEDGKVSEVSAFTHHKGVVVLCHITVH